jgi:CDP-diacylglycerol---glycerol-3-phosphate 3-phosphatidyltransferase
MRNQVGTEADVTASMLVLGSLAAALVVHAIATAFLGARGLDARVAREQAMPLVGRTPMQAVYRAVVPLARALVALGVSANAVTLGALAFTAAAAVCFGTGHFGLGAAIACVGALADAMDGFIARETRTASRFGQILDTTVDRYVDALLLGGIAVAVRSDAALLILVLASLVGGFMVSYASSVMREVGVDASTGAMRRSHRLAYLLGGAALVPFVSRILPEASMRVQLAPLVLALAAIAVIANVSAVRRLLVAARHGSSAEPSPLRIARSGRAAGRASRASRPIEPTATAPETAHR